MDRGNPRGGNPGGPGRPPGGPGRSPGGPGPGRAPGSPGQAPAAPERIVSRPPSTLTDMSVAAVQAALRSEGRVEQAPPDASLPGVASAKGGAPPAKGSAPPARDDLVPSISDARPAKAQEVRVKVGAAPAAEPDGPVSLTRAIFLVVGLILGALGAALPAVALGWLVLALVVQTGTSEILERTGGLAPTTFGGGYWLSLGVHAAVLLWCAVRRLRRRPAPWRPLVALVAGLAVTLWALVSIDACGLADVPDVLTTFALLGADVLVQYLLPVALLVLLLQGVLYAARVGRASTRAARRITAVSGCLGLSGLSAAAMIVLFGAGGPLGSLRAHAGDVRIADLGGVDAARQRYERVAATVDATSVRLCR